MSIFRVEKNANYTVMNRTALNDKRLSWKAKGIIAYMLSMPDDWVFYIQELITHSTDGEKSFRSGLKELKDFGYVKRYPVYQDKKITHWETVIHEVPQNDLDAENLQVGSVHVGKEALLNTDIKPSTEETNGQNEFDQFWSIYPKKVKKKTALQSFKRARKTHSLETILEGTKKYDKQLKKNQTASQFILHPSTFLNQEAFIDGYEETEETTPQRPVEQQESVLAGIWGESP